MTPRPLLRYRSDGLRASVLGLLLATVMALENAADFPLSVPFLRRSTGHVYLDMCAFCSGDRVASEVNALGERGRLLQALLLPTVDVVIPVLSCAFGVYALRALWPEGWAPRARRVASLLPWAAMLLDFTENGTIVGLLLGYPSPSLALASAEGLISGLKFAAYGAVVLTVAAAAFLRATARNPAAARS